MRFLFRRMQIPGIPSPPTTSSFEWWLIGVSVLGAGAVGRWFMSAVASKDDALSKAHAAAVNVLVEHVVETRKLSAAIVGFGDKVETSIAAHIAESRALALETKRLADLKELQVEELMRKVEMLKELLAMERKKHGDVGAHQDLALT